MTQKGSTSIKAIAVLGIVAFGFLGLSAAFLKKAALTNAGDVVRVRRASSPFDSQRAYRDLETIVALGPRNPGSEAHEQLRELIAMEIEAAGLELREHTFSASTPMGNLEMCNLTGVVKGNKAGVIILGNHYDTKYFPDFAFVGANDGGSTTAWMIEMARALGPQRKGRSVWLCFFDGEEAIEQWSATDGLYGSREFVEHLEQTGDLAKIEAMINVDMIGDCHLGVERDPDADEGLARAIWSNALELEFEKFFLPNGKRTQDDHIPFRQAGIPSINIIDFSYGGGALDHKKNWHTVNDTLDRVCVGSLQAVGDVIYHALSDVDLYLDAEGGGQSDT